MLFDNFTISYLIMYHYRITLIFIFLFTSLSVISQINFPDNGIVYNDNLVPRIDIIINSDSLSEILASGNEWSYHEFPADFIFTINNTSDTIFNVGFRLRGNTSRFSAKKSFKVSFNSFGNKSFHGLDKLNINGEHNDPSIIRSKVCWDICHDFGVPGPRSNHVELYINNEYKGLYINVEHVDEEFINVRFGNNDGNLYKCLWPADMSYLGNDPNLYKAESNGRRMYELKTNTAVDDYSGLANFINILNNTPINNLAEELESVFDVYGYLKYLVVEAFTGHWDGYSFNKNNYYLYDNPETGLFEFLPYDMDNTLGIDWLGPDWGTRDINYWANENEARPLTTRILEVPEYFARYNFLFNKLMQEVVRQEIIFPKIGNRKLMIQSYVVNDIYHSMDWGYDYQDFIDSYLEALGGHVDYGLIPYFSQRYSSAYSQLILSNISPIISQVSHNTAGPSQLIGIKCTVVDEDLAPDVMLYYKINSLPWDSAEMFDDGLNYDTSSGDEIYGALIGPAGESGQLNYYFQAEDSQGAISRFPLSGSFNLFIYELADINLTINEYMASNSSTITDESGSYDDWIELYNFGNTDIYLGDKYLTDDFTDPVKWQLPDLTITPGEYMILWADGQNTQGIKHTNFKLSASGEEIAVFESDGLSVIDHIVFSVQENDISEGRLPNGIGPVQQLAQPTPGYSNELQSVELYEISQHISIYPNPFSDKCTIDISTPVGVIPGNIDIYNIYGQRVYSENSFNGKILWNAKDNSIIPGIYIIRITGTDGENNIIYSGKVIYSGSN